MAHEYQWKAPAEDILAAVESAVESGDRDILAGGVPAEKVANRLSIHQSTASKRLGDLADAGEVVQVWGACPQAPYRARPSYLLPETTRRLAKRTRSEKLDETL